ncbi:IS100 transposase [Escherichia coli]|nr:IS100 transposase [Escherichia coli]
MRGVSSPMRVIQEGPDGLSRYCPVRVICLEIQLCFLTGVRHFMETVSLFPGGKHGLAKV